MGRIAIVYWAMGIRKGFYFSDSAELREQAVLLVAGGVATGFAVPGEGGGGADDLHD